MGAANWPGEQAICAQAGRFLIFRTTWVYDAHGKNFLNTISGLEPSDRSWPSLTTRSARRHGAARSRGLQHKLWGFTCNARSRSRSAEFIISPHRDKLHGLVLPGLLRNVDCLPALTVPPTLRAISSKEYPTPAKRPMNSVLSNAKLRGAIQYSIAGLEIFLAGMFGNVTVPDRHVLSSMGFCRVERLRFHRFNPVVAHPLAGLPPYVFDCFRGRVLAYVSAQ